MGSIQGFYSIPDKHSACPISVWHNLLIGRKRLAQQYYFQVLVAIGNRIVNDLSISSKFIHNKTSFTNLTTLVDRIFLGGVYLTLS